MGLFGLLKSTTGAGVAWPVDRDRKIGKTTHQ